MSNSPLVRPRPDKRAPRCEDRAMNRRTISTAALAAICFAAASNAEAQAAEGVVGTWTLVAADIQRDGYRLQTFGPDPSGTLLLGGDGHYALIFLRRDLPRIASRDRTSETPNESEAIAQGSIAHFGTYVVDGDALVFRIQGGTFPNWTGSDQRRKFTLVGNTLRYTSPGSTGFPTQVTMRRDR
jgi:Lipocalin-like domain